MRLNARRVVVGVGGGIAAYKAAELVRALTKAGAEVRVVMTESATRFVTPLTFQALSGHPVGTSLFDPGYEHEIGHIELARWADAIIVAPATANLIARMAHGMADDLLTTVLLATRARVLVCPAMNTQMLKHPATVANLETLAARDGVVVVPSDHGELACHEVGAGRLPDAPVIVDWCARALATGALRGRRVVVSAGPTREHFDPARFLSNPSSGAMGFALAAAAWEEGADVTLVAGPVSLATPTGVTRIDVRSAADMADAVGRPEADVLVMAAAVADWAPSEQAEHKRKKGEGPWSPTLERTPDILAAIGSSSSRPRLLIGFAAETRDIETYAQQKLEAKRLDGIVANDVGGDTGAFGNPDNTVSLLSNRLETRRVGPLPKRDVAAYIVRWLVDLEATHE